MGLYINKDSKGNLLPTTGKAFALQRDGAAIIPEPKQWDEGIICVVDNGFFDAAGYCFNKAELEAFRPTPSDTRKRWWLHWPLAKQLAS